MRSKRGIFWYSLGLTLLLLLPMILTVAFFTDQYQKQQLLRQASAADITLRRGSSPFCWSSSRRSLPSCWSGQTARSRR